MMAVLAAASAPAAERPRPDVAARARWSYTDAGVGLPHTGQWRDGFAIADVDGDGFPDVVHGPARKRFTPPVIFRGDGHGAWRAWDAARFPRLPYDYGDVAVADLDGDGVADLVLGAHLRGVFALRGARDGQFTDASRGLDGPAGAARVTSHAVAVVDWDGDGRPDVLALGEGFGPAAPVPGAPLRGTPGLAIFRNLGADGWQRLPANPATSGPAGSALAVGDLDGDGRPDAVTGTDQLGRSDLRYAPTADSSVRAAALAGLPASSLIRGVAIDDLDGDGHADLVVGSLTRDDAGWYGRLDVLWSTAGTWQDMPLAVLDGRAGIGAVATGDLDGDGRRDLVAMTGDGRMLAFAGAGGRTFVRETEPRQPWDGRCAGSHVVLADVDGDRRDEIVASFAQEDDGEAGGTCGQGGGLAAWRIREAAPSSPGQ